MNLKKASLTAAITLGLALGATAQTTRVAYVDIDRVTEKSDKINTAMGKVSNRVEVIQKEIETKRARLVELQAEVKKGAGVLADSELKKKRDEASKLEKEMVDLEYEGRRELQKLDTTLFEPMIKTIVLAIQDVAREKKIDLVVRGEAVIYGADSADITDAVVDKLNSSDYSTEATDSSSSSETENNSDSDDTESTSSSEENGGSAGDRENSDSDEKAGKEGESKKSILPSVPLVLRPVDRQQE